MEKKSYKEYLKPEYKKLVTEAEKENNLFNCVDKWLARCPYLFGKNWNFWKEYCIAIKQKIKQEKSNIELDNKSCYKKEIQNLEQRWEHVLNVEKYENLKEKKQIRLSFKAFQGCIFVNVYRTEWGMQVPSQILSDIMDVDENLRSFRNRHADMVQRMIGMQVGTGGSSGYHYLRTSATKHQIFTDLFNVSSYFLEPKYLPEAPNGHIFRLNREK